MKAIECGIYGEPGVLELKEISIPSPKPYEVLIRNYAATVTAADTMMRIGKPYIGRLYLGLRKPNKPILGFEFAGQVVATGINVSLFKIGDKVFGGTTMLGCYAEYVCVNEKSVMLTMPANISFEEASPVSGSAITVLNFLKDIANIKRDDNVLINGASGGLGTYAVQYAKLAGAHVTGVCSSVNIELVKTLGADKVIDYSTEDFTKNGEQYDIIFDTVGKRRFSECKRSLKPNGIYLSPVLSFPLMLQSLTSLFSKDRKAKFSFTGMLPVQQRLSYFIELKELLKTGKLKTILDTQYPLSKIADAHKYVEKGHKKGNVVITVS